MLITGVQEIEQCFDFIDELFLTHYQDTFLKLQEVFLIIVTQNTKIAKSGGIVPT